MSDKSVVDQIKHYQRDIIKCPENTKRMIRCIERLMVLPVTIAHLQETGVGRSVNELRKCGGEVGAAANALVCKWKSMVQAEEDSDVESEVEEDESKETVQVSSPDIRNSPSIKNESADKYKNNSVDVNKKIHGSEDYRKSKSDHSSKKSEPSHSENRHKSSETKSLDKHDHKSHRSKSSKSEYGSGSNSKHSSSHRPKSDHDSRSNNKSHSSHKSASECNGDMKTEIPSSKTKHHESKMSKSASSETKNKDVRQKSDKDKHRREDNSHRSEKENQRRDESSHRSVSSSSSKKYDVRRIESESSDDEKVYKPRSKKQKTSESEEDQKSEIRSRRRSESEEDEKHYSNKYSGRIKHRDSIKHESSEESDVMNSSEDENSRTSSRHSETQDKSDIEDEMSNRSSPNNVSDNEAESDSQRSSLRGDENEESHSEKASDSDEDEATQIYVPTKIKREKESPPRHQKTSNDKSKSSHSRSSHTSTHNSSNHSSSHNSSSPSKNYKESSNKKYVSENVKIKKEKDESEDLKKRREEKLGEKKSHKSSNSHTDSPNKASNKTEKKVKIKVEKQDDGSIDSVSGASFADALMGLSEAKKKPVKRKSTPLTTEKPSKSTEKAIEGKSKSFIKTEPRTSSSPSSSSKPGFKEPDLLSKNIKLEPLDVDLKSTLPEISPHYKPLPHYSPPVSPPGKRTKMLSQEEALCSIMSTKNQRTKVYSGNKSGYLKVPSLFDLCIQVLRDNIEALEYTGGVPYDLLKPVLDRATASQLFQLEHYNPYLVEDTDGLWKFHCNKDFRGKEPDEFETWRELYVRLLDERERKLEALKANITQSMAKNMPVRQTKLAYVDSVVKPPRNIAKKQMKFGTGKAVKHELVSKAMVGAASSSPAPAAVPVPAPPTSARSSHSNAFPIPGFLKKKKAPLMQKTLQLIKGNRFKR